MQPSGGAVETADPQTLGGADPGDLARSDPFAEDDGTEDPIGEQTGVDFPPAPPPPGEMTLDDLDAVAAPPLDEPGDLAVGLAGADPMPSPGAEPGELASELADAPVSRLDAPGGEEEDDAAADWDGDEFTVGGESIVLNDDDLVAEAVEISDAHAVEVDDVQVVEPDAVEAVELDDAMVADESTDVAIAPPEPEPSAPKAPPPPPRAPAAAQAVGEGEAPPPGEETEVDDGVDVVAEEPVAGALELESPTALDRATLEATRGDWPRHVRRLRAEIAAADDPRTEGALAFELGEVYSRFLDDEASAIKSFGRALSADPSLRANLWAIRRVFYRRGLWPNLVKLIDAELQFARDDAERADLVAEKGVLLEDKLDDVQGAAKAFEQALGFDPSCESALRALERLALRGDSKDALASLWRGLANSAPNPSRRVCYLLDLSRLEVERGNTDAARAILDEAAQTGAERRRVLEARLALAEKADDAEAIIAALETRASTLGESFGPAGLPEGSMEARLPGTPLDAETAVRLEIAALRRRQARLALDRLGDGERAWFYVQNALAIAPGEHLVLADVAETAERLERFDDLADVLSRWQENTDSRGRQLELALRRAEALVRAGKREDARAAMDALAQRNPGYLPVVTLAERDAMVAGDWPALAEAYAALAEALRAGTAFGPGTQTPPDRDGAAALYTCAGDLLANYVGDDESARNRYGQALEVCPGYAPAVEAMASLHEAAGRLEEAAELLELQSEAGDEAFRLDTLHRLARLYEDLGRPADQLAALRRAYALTPDSDRLLWRIEEVLGAMGDSARRTEALSALAERAEAGPQRNAILLELARVYDEELDQVDDAARCYAAVIEAAPDDAYPRSARAALLRRAGRWQALAEARRGEAEALPDGPAASRALREAALVYLDRLDEPGLAADVYGELLDRSPDDTHAARGLAESLERAGRNDRLFEVLEREVEAHEDPAARAAALLRLADARERAGELADAEEAHRHALEVSGGDSIYAAVSAWHLAARRGDLAGVVEAMDELARARSEPALRAELTEELGWLAAAALEDDNRALDAFFEASELEPGRLGAALGLLYVHGRAGNSAGVTDALAGLAGGAPPRLAAALGLRASTGAAVGGDRTAAAQFAASALSADASDSGAVVLASELPAAAQMPEQWAQRAGLLQRRAEMAVDAPSRDHWELDRAVALSRAGDLAGAGEAVKAVLARSPGNLRALYALRRLCELAGDRAGLARCNSTLAAALTGSAAQLALLREAVAIFDGELGDPAAAVPVYRRILQLDPAAAEFDRARELCRAQDDTRGVYELLTERLIHLGNDGPAAERTPLLLERARLRLELGDKRGAARDLELLLTLDAGVADALELHGGLVLELGNPARAAELLESFVAVAEDPTRRAAAELTLSQILAESMGDTAGAIEQLAHVVQESPDDVSVRERLIGLLLRAGEVERAIDEVRALEPLRSGAAERARDELRIAGLCRDQLGDRARARSAYERARELDPLNLDAVRELADLVAVDGERVPVLEGAAGELRAAIAAAPGRSELYERLAILMRWLGDDDARAFALAAVAAMGGIDDEQAAFFEQHRRKLRARPFRPSRTLSAEEWASRVGHPAASGPLAEIWSHVAEAAARCLPHEPGQLGFARGDRRTGRALAREFPTVASVADALGVGAFEVYVTDEKRLYARVVSLEKPVLYLSGDVALGAGAPERFLLGRAFAMARDRSGTLADLRGDDLVMTLAAAVELAEAPVPAQSLFARVRDAEPAAFAERRKALGKQLSRKARKTLAALAGQVAAVAAADADAPADAETTSIGRWARGLLATASRVGVVVAGDLDAALEILDVGRGGRSVADDPWGLDLLSWSVGDGHMAMRQQLGLSTVAEGGA